jgi:hypothetical protein
MRALWVAPLLLVLLSLAWFAVQRAWLACMQRPADSDALERPGTCGTACACRTRCSSRRQAGLPVEPTNKETAS